MKPRTFAEQTEEVVQALFAEFSGHHAAEQTVFNRDLVVDSATGEEQEDDFDPYIVASRLRSIGDQLDAELAGCAQQLITETAKERLQEGFSEAVRSLSTTWVSASPEMGAEKCLMKAAVNLALYLSRKAPTLAAAMHSTLTNFLTSPELSTFVQHQGGWMEVEI
ncbi:bcl-2-like protein 15 [Ambystoma mexicanum]|uniref:bcl-2-like protein 15 n=1 Tax=Ambystoma mexicanum TaxID=8296 RepID=UPI0037E8724F